MPPLPPLYTLSHTFGTVDRPSSEAPTRRVRTVTAVYQDPHGEHTYHSFEASAGVDPVIPNVATLQELRDLRCQW